MFIVFYLVIGMCFSLAFSPDHIGYDYQQRLLIAMWFILFWPLVFFVYWKG